MAKSKSKSNQNSSEAPKKQFGKQLTHFLCFPLLSDEILRTFGSSLEHFRSVSTAPPRESSQKVGERTEIDRSRQEQTPEGSSGNSDETKAGATSTTKGSSGNDKLEPEDEAANEGGTNGRLGSGNDPLRNTSNNTGEMFEKSLKVIPSIAHRPLGTYHLTIGVMNLKDPEDFKRAEEIFRSLDLQQLLKDAEQGPPAGSRAGRKWEGSRKDEWKEKEDEVETDETVKDAQTDTTSKLKSLERPVSPPPTSKISNTSPLNESGTTSPTANSSATAQDPTSASPQTPDPKPIYISLLGLSAFTSPKRARVLFAHPQEQTSNHQLPSTNTTFDPDARPSFDDPFPNRLYDLALHIEALFRTAGLITQTRPLTLHATLANMRFAVQAKGGRTSKGKDWTRGRRRWDDGTVDARGLCRVFVEFNGDVGAAEYAMGMGVGVQKEEQNDGEDDSGMEGNEQGEAKGRQDDRDNPARDLSKEFIWAKNMPIDRLALCEMSAKKSDDPLLGLVYPPVFEKRIFE